VLAYLLVRELNVIGRFEQQRARQWDDRLIGRLHGRSLGVMGTGSIGQAIGRAASALGMRVTGYSRRGRPVEPFRQVYAETELATFLSQCDAVAAVLPDTPATRGLMNERAFAAMPTGSYFINVGRGSLVDENALVKAVCDGRLAGAALDVFRTEPLPQNSPLWDTPGILVTAHVAAHSYPGDIAALFLRNYHRFREGRPLLYEIDFKQGY